MTGTGAYFYLTWGIWLRHCLNGQQDDFELLWPRIATSIPVVVRKRTAAPTVEVSPRRSQRHQNGGVKKTE